MIGYARRLLPRFLPRPDLLMNGVYGVLTVVLLGALGAAPTVRRAMTHPFENAVQNKRPTNHWDSGPLRDLSDSGRLNGRNTAV